MSPTSARHSDPNPPDPGSRVQTTPQDIEKRLKDRLEANAQQFINDTDWDYLVPQLVPKKLVDVAALEYLLNDGITKQKKGNFFYLKALPTKGIKAYTLFRQCLANEKQHSGHESLWRILADV